MDSIETRKYHYGAGLITVATATSGKLSSVQVDSLLEQR